jgi:hypothetical protein
VVSYCRQFPQPPVGQTWIDPHLSGLIFEDRDEPSCLRGLDRSCGLKRFE